jgi:hypothetical protein
MFSVTRNIHSKMATVVLKARGLEPDTNCLFSTRNFLSAQSFSSCIPITSLPSFNRWRIQRPLDHESG